MKQKAIISLAVITVIVVAVIMVGWLISLSAPQVQMEEQTTLSIQGPDAIEVGERVPYALTLDGRVCINNLEDQVVEWSISRNGQLMNVGQTTVTVMSHSAGEFVLRAEFSGLTTEKLIQVYPRANIALDMKTWIHPGEWYATGIDSIGTTEASLSLYRVLETGRRVAVSPGTWEQYGFEEIVIHENGNYVLVAESEALSNGRTVSVEKALTVTPYVQRGYHAFSWDMENLVQLTPADHLAIRNFLRQELGIEVNLLPDGRLRDANRISTDYVFYKDSSRRDVIVYQTGVEAQGQTIRKMWQTSVKGTDGRYLYVSWDDFVVSVNIGNPGTSMVSSYRDSGSSSSGGGSSGGGGPSPSPSIGGPSPSPSI